MRGNVGDEMRPWAAMTTFPSRVPRAASVGTRLRVPAVCTAVGLVLEIAGWSLLTMPVFAAGEACGAPLSAGSGAEWCGDQRSVVGWFGWLFVLAGAGLLWVALRQVWHLTERLRP